MPHCIIEYSHDLAHEIPPNQLIHLVYQGALNSQLFDANDIKTRAIPFRYFSSGDLKQDFVHVTIKILSGRNCQQRKLLSSAVMQELTQIKQTSISLTVEVVEIEKESYNKVIK